MKKQKSIIIKNPRIQRFRNNLRLLIRLAVYDEVDILRDEIRKLDHIGKYSNGKFPTEEEKKKSRILKEKESILWSNIHKSICYCRVCKEYDNNMIFFPHFNEWFCIDCYNTHYESWMESTKLAKEQNKF
jgi:hypothetical protein